MTLARITDHVEQGLALLITQYRGKPRLAAWTSAYLRQVQVLEDAIYDVLIKRMIDNASGEQLDVVGRIVGEPRDDNDDANLRIFINARIRMNRSRGNSDDVLAVLQLISATPVRFAEYRAATIFIGALVVTDRDPVLIYNRMHGTKAGGVKLTFVVPTTNTRALLARSVGDADDPLHAAGDATNERPTLSSAAEPFDLSTSHTLQIDLAYDDAGITPAFARTAIVTFANTDFAIATAATAAEVAAALAYRLPWNFAGTVEEAAGTIVITGRRKGVLSTLTISGNAGTALGFAGALEAGTGDTTFGLAADVVTQRSPNAPPPVVPGLPIVGFADPPSVDE